MAGFEFSVQEETPVDGRVMDVAPLHSPELSEAVARPRLRTDMRRLGRGGSRRQRSRGLGVAEIERVRCCSVNRLQDLNVATAAAMLEDAAAAST